MVISGPGGVGKSTLLGRFILDHARALERDRFPSPTGTSTGRGSTAPSR